ncbi:MAG: hypothetical protein GDA39_02130 [Hyphomonadaceae bacterium]|nr:hypothetical protein [Hyphomonadaceae bacterium]MBC6411774.1 hypothetical protein [Hyphomonadaceae bacterium]
MAFTHMEVQEAEAAVHAAAGREDLLRLGLIYSTDVGDRGPDFVAAHKWLSLAAMMGSHPARAYCEKIRIEMTPGDITLAQHAARGWLAENREVLQNNTLIA